MHLMALLLLREGRNRFLTGSDLVFDLTHVSCRLLFATTNHIERLDPALSRPGRMDVWVNFTNATKWQAEGIFKCFFPSRSAKEKAEAEATAAASEKSGDEPVTGEKSIAGTRNVPGIKRKAPVHAVPLLEEEEINELAKRFAEQIPEDEMSVRTHPALTRILRSSSILRFTFDFNLRLFYLWYWHSCIYRLQVFRAICSRTRHVRVNASVRSPNGECRQSPVPPSF